MLSRGSSDVGSRLRRAKSSSSVKRTHHIPLANTSLNREAAYQQALAAASCAMERASERGSCESSRQSAITRKDSDTNRTTGSFSKPQVVRFLRPPAVHNNRPTRRTEDSIITSSFEDLKGRGTLLTAIPQIQDNSTGDGFNSTPSSYRRLRKAKSMFSPRTRASSFFTLSTPSRSEVSHFRGLGRQSFEVETDESRRPGSALSLRLRRSISRIQRGGDHITNTLKRAQGNDAAIQIARDQFLLQLEQQRLRERPSFIFAPKVRKQQKSFRKTVRSSSTNSYGAAISSDWPRDSQPGNFDKAEDESEPRKRSLSSSLKHKLKRVFRKSLDSRPFPPQQLDATRPHFRDYLPTDSGINQAYEDIPWLDGASVSRASRERPIPLVPSNEDGTSRAGSIRSVPSRESLTNTTSRITSWTNSTAANTIATRSTTEKKRLSVIQEHGGPHQPSSSAGRVGDGYAIFRKPLRTQHSNSRLNAPVDTQRLYSAMRKRIDETSPSPSPVTPETTRKPVGSLSRQDSNGSRRAATTIRTVPRDFAMEVISVEGPDSQASFHSIASQTSIHSGNGVRLTPQQLALHNEGILKIPKLPLRESRSSFFPFTAAIKAHTPSPFKRAMIAQNYNQPGSDDDNIVIKKRGQTHVPDGSESLRETSGTGSASVYSRSPGEITPIANDEDTSPAGPDENEELGTAMILTDAKLPGQKPFAVINRRSLRPSKSTTEEWHMWMSSQVANFDRHDSMQRQEVRSPTYSHYRETAQIDSDDTQVGSYQPYSVPIVSRSRSTSQPRASSRFSPPRRLSSATMNDRFPLLETNSSIRNSSVNSRRTISPSPGTNENSDEIRKSSPISMYQPPNRIRMRASQATLRSERNYSDPRPRELSASSNHVHQRQSITLPSSETTTLSHQRDIIRAQSAMNLRDNIIPLTPNIVLHTSSFRSGLSRQYLNENKPFAQESSSMGFTEKQYDGDDEFVTTAPGRTTRESKTLVERFLNSRRQRQTRLSVSSERENEPAFV